MVKPRRFALMRTFVVDCCFNSNFYLLFDSIGDLHFLFEIRLPCSFGFSSLLMEGIRNLIVVGLNFSSLGC